MEPIVFDQNNLFLTVLGISTLAGVYFFMRYQFKQHPKMKAGAIINKLIIENRESVILFLAALANFFEAVVSASIHPEGQPPINSFARFGAHTVIAFIAITCALYFGQFARSWLQSWLTIGKDPFRFFIRLVLVILTLAGTLAAPIANLFIVANGTGEIDNCIYLIMELRHSDAWMEAYYQYYGLPIDYNPFKSMTYVMGASVIMTGAHYLLILIDSAIALDKDSDFEYSFSSMYTKDADDKVNDNDAKKKGKDMKNFESHIKFMLMRFGYKKDSLNKTFLLASEKLDKISEESVKIEIARSASAAHDDIKTIEKNSTYSEDEKKTKIKERIKNFFKGSIKKGAGLGMTLKNI